MADVLDRVGDGFVSLVWEFGGNIEIFVEDSVKHTCIVDNMGNDRQMQEEWCRHQHQNRPCSVCPSYMNG